MRCAATQIPKTLLPNTCFQVEPLDIPEALELRKLRLLKDELGELAAQGAPVVAVVAERTVARCACSRTPGSYLSSLTHSCLLR